MAGVYINGVRKPYGCSFCPWCQTLYCFCKAANKNISVLDMNKGPDWCPLVEVPDHGDLIDANTMIGVELYDECREEWYEEAMTVWEYLGHASTANVQIVIPADKEGV